MGAYNGAPRCNTCNALMKPDAVYFGESLDEKVLIRSQSLVRKAECILVVGSNCSVAPANSLPATVKREGGVIIEINPQKSVITGMVDVHLPGPAAAVLPH